MRLLPVIILFLSGHLIAQDKPSIDSLVFKAKEIVSQDPDESLKLSQQAYKESIASDYYWGKANAAGWISEAYYYKGQMDSMDKYNDKALVFAREENDLAAIGDNLISIGQSKSDQGNQELALTLFEEARVIKEELKDTIDLSDLHLRYGAAYDDLDMVDSAMVHYDIALSYSKAIDHKELVGQSLNNIAILHKKLGDFDKALSTLEESKEMLMSIDNKYGLLINSNMTGVIYKSMGRYEEALVEYEELKRLSEELNFERGNMAYGINAGTIYNLINQPKKAEDAFRIGIRIAGEFDIPLSLSDAKSGLSRSLLRQGELGSAEKEMKEALELAVQIESLDKQLIAHKVAKEIYEEKKSLTETVYHLEQIQMLNDSVFNIEKAKQVDELQTKYEAAKKDAEIITLNKNAEIDAARKRTLTTSLILLFIAAASIIYSILQRRKKDKAIAGEKLKSAERELEFKKKELTAKALQLARKNEFLSGLESEIEELKPSVDTSVGKTSARISRMIQMDANDDQDWEQFGKEFSSIHQDFLNRLQAQYGKFSKNELRLIALMKMNLSSKDIANTLRISENGIKKARYRLRKKLALESDVDIQNYLIAY